jgi:energy-coupling factor transporter ATP-binding protein EcfA2
MAELSTDVRIFLSSTFVDLKDLREEVANRLRDVLGADLLIMETFGSDEAPPEISSVRRVRESDVFVGIYARRYGTVDRMTGKSITELELDEAERSLSAGNLTGILLYWLADDAAWPAHLCEAGTAAAARLSALKDHARQHTYTLFCDPADLPFFVIRDVLAKIRNRLTPPSFQVRQLALPGDRRLPRPIGMEFLTSADGRHLYGRGEKIKELLGRIDANRITLLLGNSGSGKTSLIHAGLFPAAIGAGWFPVYSRPLGLPRSDVVTALLASVFEGPHSYRGALLSPLEQAAAAVVPQRLLLIIDQFEDILTARDEEEAERLVRDLQTLHCLDDRRIRVLVSYRADLEARLGRFWQTISGSPEGLARVYVAGIGASEAWKAVESACSDLRIKLELSEAEKAQMGKDLQSFSASHGEEGVYPPYIQMFIDHIWRKTGSKPGTYRFDDYLTSGAMEGVTAGYLTRQLAYARDAKGQLKSALVSLVRSYGVKAQKSLAEVAVDMGLAEKECDVVLERLIDLRLVRHVADLYEVAHDFLAREISAKLVDSEEKEFKRVRELVASKSATYTTTHSLLTVEEMLMLFKYKERVLPSDGEVRLILASWVEEQGPGLYLLLGSPSSRLVELIRDEESKREIDDEDRAMLALLRRKVSGSPLGRRDWSLFRRYQLGMELAGIISTAPLECPDQVLLWALRSKRRTVRDAAFEAVAKKVANGHRKWIAVLSSSSSPLYRSAYEQLAVREDLPLFPTDSSRTASRPLREFGLVQRIARVQPGPVLRASLNELKRFRPRARIWLFARGTATHRTAGLTPTLMKLPKLASSKVATLMNSASGNLSEPDFLALLGAYLKWNQKEAGLAGKMNRRLSRIYEDKASVLAKTIFRLSTKRNLKPLRNLFEKITLTPSAQYFALALLLLGSSADIVKIIKKVEQVGYDIRYWFQIEMGRIIEKRMKEIGGPIPIELLRICRRKGFWGEDRDRKSKVARKDKLPLKCMYNRALYLRLVAHAMIGAARQDNLDLLERLAQHNYRMIARAAAVRLAQLGGDTGIKMLQSAVTTAIERGNAEAFGLAVRDAEIQRFGLIGIW